MRSVKLKHLVEQPGFDHVVVHGVMGPSDTEELRLFQQLRLRIGSLAKRRKKSQGAGLQEREIPMRRPSRAGSVRSLFAPLLVVGCWLLTVSLAEDD